MKKEYEELLTSEKVKVEELSKQIEESKETINHLEQSLEQEKAKLINIINEDKSRNDEKSHVLLASVEKLEMKYESDMKEKESIINSLNIKFEQYSFII
jgi:hypothetical protein